MRMNRSFAMQSLQSRPLMSQSQELSYVEALKSHQMSRLEHIRSETIKLRLYLQTLRNEVMALEARQQKTSPEGVNWASKVSKLRDDNRSLRIECHCLSMEVDLYASGQMPLGITDENFYKNIPAGPNGPLLATQTSCPPLGNSGGSFNRPVQPPTYEESVIYPPPRFGPNLSSNDILCQVPPAPRPVWLSPAVQTVQQPIQQIAPHPHSIQSPPLIPPRPNSISPRTPSAVPQSQTLINQNVEEGQRWVCEKCTVENHPALAYCEVCEMPRNGYLGINNNNDYHLINQFNCTNHVQTVDSNQYECYCHNYEQ